MFSKNSFQAMIIGKQHKLAIPKIYFTNGVPKIHIFREVNSSRMYRPYAYAEANPCNCDASKSHLCITLVFSIMAFSQDCLYERHWFIQLQDVLDLNNCNALCLSIVYLWRYFENAHKLKSGVMHGDASEPANSLSFESSACDIV